MGSTMEQLMSAKPSNTAKGKAMSAAFTATERARGMILDIGGPRTWNDTKESWRARVARHLRLSPRRVRAILANEPIRLTADEYLGIQNAWEAARVSVASISALARDADVRAGRLDGVGEQAPVCRGQSADS